jgi:hypothetical protein
MLTPTTMLKDIFICMNSQRSQKPAVALSLLPLVCEREIKAQVLPRDNIRAVDLDLPADELASIEVVIRYGGYGDRYGQFALLEKARNRT